MRKITSITTLQALPSKMTMKQLKNQLFLPPKLLRLQLKLDLKNTMKKKTPIPFQTKLRLVNSKPSTISPKDLRLIPGKARNITNTTLGTTPLTTTATTCVMPRPK